MDTAPAPHDEMSVLHLAGNPASRTLRTWLDHCFQRDRLALMRPGVSLRHELAAVAKRFEGRKACLFPSPDGHTMPVVAGLMSNRAWIADALGVAPDSVLPRIVSALEAPRACTVIDQAPFHETVVRDNIDLVRLLPVVKHNSLDSGSFITAGLVIARNPETGKQNASIHRCELKEPGRLGIVLESKHLRSFQVLAERSDLALPIAIAIGVDPLCLLASQASLSIDEDELNVASALHAKPLELVRCQTSDLMVPSQAEIVIEGRILPRVREMEGPFGEFPQTYSVRAAHHVVEVDAVALRPRAIYHTITGGSLEHLLLGGLMREARIFAYLRRSFPNLADIRLSEAGSCRYHLRVRMSQVDPGDARSVIMAAFSAHNDVKQVVVVDDDIDLSADAEVEWAIATRFQPHRDLVIVSDARPSLYDPSSLDQAASKLGLDATIPPGADRGRYHRISIPGEERIRPADYVNAEATDWRDAWR